MNKDKRQWLVYEDLTDGITAEHFLMLYVAGVLEQFEDALRDAEGFERLRLIRQDAKAKMRFILDGAYREGWGDLRASFERTIFESAHPISLDFHQNPEWHRKMGSPRNGDVKESEQA